MRANSLRIIIQNTFIRLFILALLFSATSVHAQLCTGTLGNPVVNIDFGRGASPLGPRLTANLPNLTYWSGECARDGSYSIIKSFNNCYGTWHTVASDHTPTDNDGYMMVVNANQVSGDFYIDTLRGLCPNNVYEFAAWLMNVHKPNACANSTKPNLEFRIETITGQQVASYKTGDIPETNSPEWKQLGLFFKTPVGVTTLVLRITNIAPGGCGNDLAIDDITFRPCGPPLQLTVDGVSGNSTTACLSTQPQLTMRAVLGTGYNNPVLRWQRSVDTGKTWVDFNNGPDPYTYPYAPTTGESVIFRVTVAEQENISVVNCRIVSNTFRVNVFEVGTATVNSPACTNTTVKFDGGAGTAYLWTGPNGFTSTQRSPTLTAQTNQTGFYYLDATDNNGCRGKDTVFLQVIQQATASALSPFTVCRGQSVQLSASGGQRYRWFPATGLSSDTIPDPVATPSVTTTYAVSVSNGSACADTANVVVNVSGVPTASAGPDLAILRGQSVTLRGTAAGTNIDIQWSPNSSLVNDDSPTPTASPLNTTSYTMRVESNDGCGSASDQMTVKVFDELKIPNAFSPNGDGINDTWRMDALAVYPNASVKVFDRYGDLLFNSIGYNNPWDGAFKGRQVPAGVYYYIVDLRNGKDVFTGSLTLLR